MGKRAFDVSVSLILLTLVWPLLALLSLAIVIHLGKPVFFRHTRPGLGGRRFVLYKFRTMRDARAADGRPLSDEIRLGSIGRFLRKTSLDETPQLFNVLKGDMSLVGPRPLLEKYLPLYTEEQATRHRTKPGITGWAQINGRNAIRWNEKFDLDVWYVRNYDFKTDVRILTTTVSRILRREGIAYPGCSTAIEFDGSN
jgi:sugar transferase EpsL